MFHIYKNGDVTESRVTEFIADTLEDVQELPTNVAPGSLCLVIQGTSGAAVFSLGNDKQWHEL